MVVVSVAYVDAFAVEDFEVFAGPVVVCWVVFETFGEGGLFRSIVTIAYHKSDWEDLQVVYRLDYGTRIARQRVHFQLLVLDTMLAG